MAKSFQGPRGTRDLYPEDVLRRRYITRAWRDASVRFGFEEIEGPTFEPLELYTVKSGEGIVSELFSFRREGGDDDYALRPEFTPTLARMYAARARQLPKPTKWFTAGPYFRAEKPQRGRLREFLQWNVDYIGLTTEDTEGTETAKAEADAETIACCIGLMDGLGFTSGDCEVLVNNRDALSDVLLEAGIAVERHTQFFALVDRLPKLGVDWFRAECDKAGVPEAVRLFFSGEVLELPSAKTMADVQPTLERLSEFNQRANQVWSKSIDLIVQLTESVLDSSWVKASSKLVRGLAYYTGTVFEVIAEGERAVAGGGRYDGLIELCGGPSTPAVGFAMGDVVLGLLLDDKGLMPEGAELREAVARPGASVRPEAFVVPQRDSDVSDDDVRRVVARLRRGAALDETLGDGSVPGERKAWERPAGLHARHSYKSTRNVGKLLKDASGQFARLAVIIESADEATIKDLDTGEQEDARYSVQSGLTEPGSLMGALHRKLGRGAEVGLDGS